MSECLMIIYDPGSVCYRDCGVAALLLEIQVVSSILKVLGLLLRNCRTVGTVGRPAVAPTIARSKHVLAREDDDITWDDKPKIKWKDLTNEEFGPGMRFFVEAESKVQDKLKEKELFIKTGRDEERLKNEIEAYKILEVTSTAEETLIAPKFLGLVREGRHGGRVRASADY
ncbi:Uu.00g102940.m01.CDS01 [Anthostomella pinea]|uniref:Uu.00g102940.m01.CDS01 n=1 Tax=Anthostomella pinea TaxID=933095 RepID=A0AAI8VDB6_9PEZI|nr:Uu.00g102940.m01.CDS01 [Anthostomella pinea]